MKAESGEIDTRRDITRGATMKFSSFCSTTAAASTDQNCHRDCRMAIASAGAVPRIGPITGIISPSAAKSASAKPPSGAPWS